MSRPRKNKNHLTPAKIKAFKAMLLAKQNEILGDVVCMEDETLRKPRSDLSNMPVHIADVGTDNYEMEHTLELMDCERKLLYEIEDALQRIEDGVYGICEVGDEPIPIERLEAIPWTKYCVMCASSFEKKHAEDPDRIFRKIVRYYENYD